MSVVALAPSVESEGADIAALAIATILVSFLVSCFVLACVVTRFCKCRRSPVKQVTLPSGLVVSYGGPSAK